MHFNSRSFLLLSLLIFVLPVSGNDEKGLVEPLGIGPRNQYILRQEVLFAVERRISLGRPPRLATMPFGQALTASGSCLNFSN